MLIKNAILLYKEGAFCAGDMEFDGVIRRMGRLEGDADLDATGLLLVPGLVDIHTHGAAGCDFSDGDAKGMESIARFYAGKGVTSFLATTMTLDEPTLTKAMAAVRSFRQPADGARCAGVHLEGPFFAYAKRGAQSADYLQAPDAELVERLNAASGGQVRMISMAPELEGAMPCIRALSPKMTVSVGHTVCDYSTACEAFASGATHATHMFNAMNPFLHREPGVVGAAFDCGATVELICDGLHIHPSVIRSSFCLFKGRLTLISDSLRCAGQPDGEYTLGGQPIVMKGGKATLLDGTLAGSTIGLIDAVRNCVRFGIPLDQAVFAASILPAKAVRLDGEIGSLEPGKRADFLLLDREMNLVATYIGGQIAYHA